MLWDPIRYLETCPSSDGACAIVLTDEDTAQGTPNPPAWVHGTAVRSEPTMGAGRDVVNPHAGRDCAADVYAQAGITDPRREIDCAEIYVPFSWYEPMWMENLGFAERRRRLEDGRRRQHLAHRRPARQPLRRRAVVEPDRRLRDVPVRRGGVAGARAWPVSTRSTARGARSVTPTVAAHSSSRCGSSEARGRLSTLDGKVALVTGGARGMGAAHVRQLHARGRDGGRRRHP